MLFAAPCCHMIADMTARQRAADAERHCVAIATREPRQGLMPQDTRRAMLRSFAAPAIRRTSPMPRHRSSPRHATTRQHASAQLPPSVDLRLLNFAIMLFSPLFTMPRLFHDYFAAATPARAFRFSCRRRYCFTRLYAPPLQLP